MRCFRLNFALDLFPSQKPICSCMQDRTFAIKYSLTICFGTVVDEDYGDTFKLRPWTLPPHKVARIWMKVIVSQPSSAAHLVLTATCSNRQQTKTMSTIMSESTKQTPFRIFGMHAN